jgi:hypothetical protein
VILLEVWLLSLGGGFEMGRKRHKPEEIIAKLQQVLLHRHVSAMDLVLLRPP